MEKVLALFDTPIEADEAIEELFSLGYSEDTIGYLRMLPTPDDGDAEQDVETDTDSEDPEPVEILADDVETDELPADEIGEYDFSIEDPDDEYHSLAVEELFVIREVVELEELPQSLGTAAGESSLIASSRLGAVVLARVPSFGFLLGAGRLAPVAEGLSGDTVGGTGLTRVGAAIWAEWSDETDEVPEWARPFRRGIEQGAIMIEVEAPAGEGAGLAAVLEEGGAREVAVYQESSGG